MLQEVSTSTKPELLSDLIETVLAEYDASVSSAFYMLGRAGWEEEELATARAEHEEERAEQQKRAAEVTAALEAEPWSVGWGGVWCGVVV